MISKLKTYFPLLEWLPGYRGSALRGDIVAGLTVGVMTIPQSMAYSLLAGLPPIYGLYAALVPALVYAFFGTSRHLVVGPAATTCILVAAGVGTLAVPFSQEFISLALLLGLAIGVVQFLLGTLRMGFLVNFLSNPVLNGFTSAAAVIIIFSQLKNLTGINLGRSNFIHQIAMEIAAKIDQLNWLTLVIGLAGIALILLLKKIHRAIPASLIAMVLATLGVYIFGWNAEGVSIVGEVPRGLPSFVIPDVNMNDLSRLMPSIITITFIAILQPIAVAKAIQSKYNGYQIIPNQELRALGLANAVGSFFQSFPVAGSLSRTAVNAESGAKSGVSLVFISVVIVATLVFFTGLFFFLPQAIFASIIIVAVLNLIDLKTPVVLWRTHRSDFFMLLATFLATLFIGIEEGVIFGIILSIGMVVYRSSRPPYSILGRVPGSASYRSLDRFSDLESWDDVLIYRFDSNLYFANAEHFKRTLIREIEKKGSALKLVIINAESISEIDSTAMNMLVEIFLQLRKSRIDISISGLKGPVRDILFRSGILDRLGDKHLFLSVNDAFQAFVQQKKQISEPYTVESKHRNP